MSIRLTPLPNRLIYWKVEVSQSAWNLIPDTPEARGKAVEGGAMYFTWSSLSAPYIEGNGQSASETLEGRGSSRAQWIGNPQGPRLMTIKQACQYSGLTDWCLRNLIWTGKLPFVRFGDKKVWIERVDLDALIDREKQVFGA